jgi:hypothetical protein
MSHDSDKFRIALDGNYVMRLRPSELESVAAGLGEFDASSRGNALTLAAAVGSLPPSDRAPLWELAVRRLGRHKALEQAAGEIGMDEVRGRDLLAAFEEALARVPPPESTSTL